MLEANEVEHVAMVGGGVMGGGIGQAFLQGGYEVTIRDVESEVLEETEERVVSGNFGLDRAVEGGYLTEAERDDAIDRLSLTLDLEEALADADVVIEAVPEDLALKGRVFRELDELTDAPIYSNTSGFAIAGIANAVADPSRVAGAHFFNPVPVMDLVEVVNGSETDEAVVELMVDLCEDIGKTPVTVEDSPGDYGFIVNRLWGAMRDEAKTLVEEDIATVEEINLAMREGRNLPVGPLEGAGIGEEWG